MKKSYQITSMTCKEYAERFAPELISELAFGNVVGCPFTIGLSVIPYPCKVQVAERAGVFNVREELCSICWNQPAKHHGKWIMKVKVIK